MASATDSSRAPAPAALRRSLGFRDLVVYGLLFIAPMAGATAAASDTSDTSDTGTDTGTDTGGRA
ncbi:hypothetical protein [Streptomyces virginiae]|uniref:hypothetical protein n=1 Tax=Streptomyces virginiae TaxID=1961 RepID=UPI0033A84773